MEQQLSNQEFSFLAAAFTVLLCMLFGSNAVAIKITFRGLGVFTTAGIRFGMAACAIYLWARVRGLPVALKEGQFRQVAVYSLLFTCQLSLFYFAISKTSASRATLLGNLLPFFVLFLAHVFIPGDRITKRKFFGLLLGFCGVVLVFLEKAGVSSETQIGDILMLVATFIWACNVVYIKRIIHTFNPFHLVLYSMLLSVPIFFLQALLWDRPMVGTVDGPVLVALLYQGLVTASFGFVAWNSMLQKYGVVSLHSFVFIMPVSGVFLGGLLLGEPITAKIVLAMGVIGAGIFIVHWRPKKEPVYPLRRDI
jgi:drug/metabolite transporter (DMT)-like permease